MGNQPPTSTVFKSQHAVVQVICPLKFVVANIANPGQLMKMPLTLDNANVANVASVVNGDVANANVFNTS